MSFCWYCYCVLCKFANMNFSIYWYYFFLFIKFVFELNFPFCLQGMEVVGDVLRQLTNNNTASAFVSCPLLNESVTHVLNRTNVMTCIDEVWRHSAVAWFACEMCLEGSGFNRHKRKLKTGVSHQTHRSSPFSLSFDNQQPLPRLYIYWHHFCRFAWSFFWFPILYIFTS